MSNQSTKEVHSTTTIKHSMIVKGQELMEEKKNTTITSFGSDKKLGEIESHLRKIGDKSIKTTKENGQVKEETDMSDEEKEKFNNEWQKYWKPAMTEEEIQKAVEFLDENW